METEFSGWVPTTCHAEGPGFCLQHHKQAQLPDLLRGWSISKPDTCGCHLFYTQRGRATFRKGGIPILFGFMSQVISPHTDRLQTKKMDLKITFLHVKQLAIHCNKYEFLNHFKVFNMPSISEINFPQKINSGDYHRSENDLGYRYKNSLLFQSLVKLLNTTIECSGNCN